MLVKVLVPFLSVIVTTGGIVLQRYAKFQKLNQLGLICPPPLMYLVFLCTINYLSKYLIWVILDGSHRHLHW